MNASHAAIELFSINRQKLANVLKRVRTSFETLGLKSVVPSLDVLKQRFETERLKILIVGQFKQGKTTLINALLGAEVLPADAVPCTAVINEIKYGETKRAVVHFRDPVPSPLPEHLSHDARQHIEKHGGKHVPTMEVPVDELKRYVVIPDPAKDQGESVAESPFRLVEIYWPIELCRNSVEIIDSPGLNEHGTRTRVTVDYLTQVDAVVFVLSCIALAGEAEIRFVENNLRTSGHGDIFFACNRFDQVKQHERQRVIDFGREKLACLTTLGADGVFFVSALDGLEGRLNDQAELMERSGFLPFEKRLSSFLVESRGRLKLLQPARQLVTEVNMALNEAIPQQQQMLQASTAELEKRWQEILPRAKQAQDRCRDILQGFQLECERLRTDIRDMLERFILQMADDVCTWVKSYQPKSSAKAALVKEISEFVDARTDSTLAKWQQETLTPHVQNRLKGLGQSLQESLDEIKLSLVQLKHELSGNATNQAPSGEKDRLFLSMVPGFAVGFVGAILDLTSPVWLVALINSSATIQRFLKSDARIEKIKNACANKIAADLKSRASAAAKDGAKIFCDKMEEIKETIKASLNQELQSVTDLKNSALRDKRQGEAQVQQRLVALDVIASDLQQAQSDLNDIVFDLAR